MLRHLSARDDRFKSIRFTRGMNIIVAERRSGSVDTDTRNGSGKSSLIEILHFLLGSQVSSGSVIAKPAVRQLVFRLELDWPSHSTGATAVERSPASQADIVLSPDVSNSGQLDGLPGHLSPSEWQSLLERELFGIVGDVPGI